MVVGISSYKLIYQNTWRRQNSVREQPRVLLDPCPIENSLTGQTTRSGKLEEAYPIYAFSIPGNSLKLFCCHLRILGPENSRADYPWSVLLIKD